MKKQQQQGTDKTSEHNGRTVFLTIFLIKPGFTSKTTQSIIQEKNVRQQEKFGPEENMKNMREGGTKHPKNTKNGNFMKHQTNAKNVNEDVTQHPMYFDVNRGICDYPTTRKLYTR